MSKNNVTIPPRPASKASIKVALTVPCQSLAILAADNDVDGLGHERRIAQPRPIVNLKFASVH